MNHPQQHKSPCTKCPFSRSTEPGYLGGNEPTVYVGQVNGPFKLPCHSAHDYTKLEERLKDTNAECAGAAIFRANVGLEHSPRLLHLPTNTNKVFASNAEFLAYHARIPVEVAQEFLRQNPPSLWTREEILKWQAKVAEGAGKLSIFPK